MQRRGGEEIQHRTLSLSWLHWQIRVHSYSPLAAAVFAATSFRTARNPARALVGLAFLFQDALTMVPGCSSRRFGTCARCDQRLLWCASALGQTGIYQHCDCMCICDLAHDLFWGAVLGCGNAVCIHLGTRRLRGCVLVVHFSSHRLSASPNNEMIAVPLDSRHIQLYSAKGERLCKFPRRQVPHRTCIAV